MTMLFLYEGIVLAQWNRPAESTRAFQLALQIRLDARLPLAVEPSIANHFESIRRRLQQEATAEAEARAARIRVEEPVSLFGCRAAVVAPCEQLMTRLLLLKERIPTLEANPQREAARALFRLGQRAREALSSETLKEVSQDTETWSEKWPVQAVSLAALPPPPGTTRPEEGPVPQGDTPPRPQETEREGLGVRQEAAVQEPAGPASLDKPLQTLPASPVDAQPTEPPGERGESPPGAVPTPSKPLTTP